MANPARIIRLLDSARFERLVEDSLWLRTGAPLALRLALTSNDVLPAVARAVALERLIETSYRPSPLAVELAGEVVDAAEQLLAQQLFPSAPVLACLHNALSAWSERLGLMASLGAHPEGDARTAERTRSVLQRVQHALASWAHAQLASDDPLVPTPESVGTLWLLAHRPLEATPVPAAELLSRLDAAGAGHDPVLGSYFAEATRRATTSARGLLRTPAA